MTDAEKLVELETAYHSYLTGKRVVKVGYGEEQLTFSEANIGELKEAIARLKATIAAGTTSARRPFGMTF
jgi:hypothetical protein